MTSDQVKKVPKLLEKALEVPRDPKRLAKSQEDLFTPDPATKVPKLVKTVPKRVTKPIMVARIPMVFVAKTKKSHEDLFTAPDSATKVPKLVKAVPKVVFVTKPQMVTRVLMVFVAKTKTLRRPEPKHTKKRLRKSMKKAPK